MGLNAWIPIRMDGYALKDDDEGARNGIAEDESGNSAKDELELRNWEYTMVEKED